MVSEASQLANVGSEAQGVKPASAQVTRVRIADKEQDIDAILPLACDMHREDRHRNLKLDKAKLHRFFMKTIDQQQSCCLLLAERNGQITGFLYASIGETFFGPSKVASCMLFYVSQKSRGSLAALKLIKAYQIWAQKQGAEQVSAHVTSGIRLHQTDRLFKKLGFELCGGNYLLSQKH